MQILQWLFKVADREQGGQNSTTTKGQQDKPRDTISSKHRSRRSKSTKKLKPFIFICNRDVAKSNCFYRSIYLRRAGNSHKGQHWSESSKKMKNQDPVASKGIIAAHKSDLGTHAGNKVLPLSSEAALSSSTYANDRRSTSSDKKDKPKGDKNKTMSRMKELLRWAAAAKSEKGGNFIGRKVLQLRNRGSLKALPADDDQFSNESPKISFRWDVESCSTITSSVFSEISTVSSLKRIDQACDIVSFNSTPMHGLNRCSSRRGNWITTDSEFVVLEL